MKKIINFLVSILALSLVSCTKNDVFPTPTLTLTYNYTVYSNYTVKFTCSDPSAVWIFGDSSLNQSGNLITHQYKPTNPKVYTVTVKTSYATKTFKVGVPYTRGEIKNLTLTEIFNSKKLNGTLIVYSITKNNKLVIKDSAFLKQSNLPKVLFTGPISFEAGDNVVLSVKCPAKFNNNYTSTNVLEYFNFYAVNNFYSIASNDVDGEFKYQNQIIWYKNDPNSGHPQSRGISNDITNKVIIK